MKTFLTWATGFYFGASLFRWCWCSDWIFASGVCHYIYMEPLEGSAMELFGPVMCLQLSTRMLTSVLVKKTSGTVGHMLTMS